MLKRRKVSDSLLAEEEHDAVENFIWLWVTMCAKKCGIVEILSLKELNATLEMVGTMSGMWRKREIGFIWSRWSRWGDNWYIKKNNSQMRWS